MAETAHTAEVVSAEGKSARVRFVRTGMCGSCGLCGMKKGESEIIIDAGNDIGAAAGDTVEVSLPSSSMLSASVIAYVVPLLLLAAGVFLGYILGPGIGLAADVTGAVLGLVLAAAGFAVLHFLEPRIRRSGRYRPNITKIVAGTLDREG